MSGWSRLPGPHNRPDRRALQIRGQPRERQRTDEPLRRIDVETPDPVAIVGRKTVMKVVVTLPQRQRGKKRVVARGGRRRVRPAAEAVGHGVDGKRSVVLHDEANAACPEEPPQRIAPRPGDQHGDNAGHPDRKRRVQAVL